MKKSKKKLKKKPSRQMEIKCNFSRPDGHRKVNSQREVHRNTCVPQETRKILRKKNLTYNLKDLEKE